MVLTSTFSSRWTWTRQIFSRRSPIHQENKETRWWLTTRQLLSRTRSSRSQRQALEKTLILGLKSNTELECIRKSSLSTSSRRKTRLSTRLLLINTGLDTIGVPFRQQARSGMIRTSQTNPVLSGETISILRTTRNSKTTLEDKRKWRRRLQTKETVEVRVQSFWDEAEIDSKWTIPMNGTHSSLQGSTNMQEYRSIPSKSTLRQGTSETNRTNSWLVLQC